MAVRALDHVNLRTSDVPGTAAFFGDILGLRAEVAPGAGAIDVACWVYDAADRPIVHIGALTAPYPSDATHPFAAARGGGVVHHVALACDDLPGMSARLAAAGLEPVVNRVPQIGLTQLFVTEANGLLLELNFDG